jgi:hypothetical protein
VTTVFDRPDFNKALFFARKTKSPKPPGSKDLFVDVAQDARVHVRLHDRPGTQALVLLFHGNGEVVADYDDLADTYERKVGASLAVADFRGYGQSTGTFPALATAQAPRVARSHGGSSSIRYRPLRGRFSRGARRMCSRFTT